MAAPAARQVVRFPVNRRRVERIIYRRQRTDRLRLGEVKSKDILKAYGFQILEGRLTTSPEEAMEIARFIGFPVALKVISPSIIHKSDLGGVRLNLGSAQEVADAFDLMMLRINKLAPNAIIGGIYVEKMAEKGLEVIIGMTRDPQFGPMLMFGLGGIFVEVMKDVTFHLAPITEEEAMQMLMGTRSYELLQGKRGLKEVDMHAIAVPPAAHQPADHRLPADPRPGDQPADRRRDGQRAGGGRCPHDLRAAARPALSPAFAPTGIAMEYMNDWQEQYSDMLATPTQALSHLKPGQRVFIGTGCGAPQDLIMAMTARARQVSNVEVIQLITQGRRALCGQEDVGQLRHQLLLHQLEHPQRHPGGVRRLHAHPPFRRAQAVQLGQPAPGYALVQVTPPNAHGRVSLGISVDITRSAIDNASLVIAEVNPNMPWTHGDTTMEVVDLDILVPVDRPILERELHMPNEISRTIARAPRRLIPNGSTIELGLGRVPGYGRIPQVVMEYLHDRKDIGFHTEMISDSIIPLVASGAVTGAMKSIDRGKITASFCMGTKKLYDYIDDNPLFSFRPTEYINDANVIGKHKRMVAVNMALEIDLTGQVCSDSVNGRFYSGIGGQIDFNRGAAAPSRAGRSSPCRRSTARANPPLSAPCGPAPG